MSTDVEINCTAVIGSDDFPAQDSPHIEVVAGYTLQDRLGFGGYGEVWRAIGPGGLPKAVKILYGRHDGPQAEAELKSLEKVRELRHPFLLSIERIEICDGRLIIVTELADRCLEDRFEEAKREGLNGIPRDELLSYLREAADALDFMYEQHGLQHLDIKPDNLLLQGEHVKIGDFGLSKDVQQAAVSLVSGFTPLYAPPEIFEGRPSPSSDQYCLAIVYQAMLTGVPPFAGRTVAQLTAQHLRSTPDLSSLQPVDRPAIARALSKNPLTRFLSCRQFVDEIINRRASRQRSTGPSIPQRLQSRDTQSCPATPPPSPKSSPVAKLESTPLPALDIDPREVTYRPTIFVGIGGLGGRILQSLKERLYERFGTEADLPSLPFLYLDTDQRAISAVQQDAGLSGLHESDVLAIPLRDAKAYRSASDVHLEWMSRRWLFNIPRSQQVEGIRPLGRLALVDHQDAVRNRLRDLISRANDEEALKLTQAQTSLSLEAGPADVFIVASISGGTGSGAVLDLAYLIRETFADLELEPGSLSGLLLHATGSVLKLGDLQQANTLCCLSELGHFNTPGLGYPGGLARQPLDVDAGPFDHACVIHLGDNLNDPDFVKQAHGIGEYLYVNTVTPLRGFFQKSRRLRREEQLSVVEACPLRTLGVATMNQSANRRRASFQAKILCQAVVRQWSIPSSLSPELFAALQQEICSLLAKLQLTDDQVAAEAIAVVRGDASKKIDAYSRAVWQQLHRKYGDQMPERNVLLRRFAAGFSGDDDIAPVDAARPASIVRAVQEQLAVSVQRVTQSIRAYVLSLVDKPGHRINGAFAALSDIVSRLDAVATSCTQILKEIDSEYKKVCGAPASRPPEAGSEPPLPKPTIDELRLQCHQYCVLRFCRTIYLCFVQSVSTARDTVKGMGAELVTLRGRLQNFEQHLEQCDAEQDVSMAAEEDSPEQSGGLSTDDMPSPSLVDAFDQHIRSGGTLSLTELLRDESEPVDTAAALRQQAFKFLLEDAAFRIMDENPSDETTSAQPLWEAAKPQLSHVGGGRRVLAVVPEGLSTEHWKQKLEDEFGDCVSIFPSADQEPFVCCEVVGIKNEAILSQIAHQKPHLADIASRLHTRIDIEW